MNPVLGGYSSLLKLIICSLAVAPVPLSWSERSSLCGGQSAAGRA